MPNWKSVVWDGERYAREEQERVDAVIAEFMTTPTRLPRRSSNTELPWAAGTRNRLRQGQRAIQRLRMDCGAPPLSASPHSLKIPPTTSNTGSAPCT
jgi:hypothetical protein